MGLSQQLLNLLKFQIARSVFMVKGYLVKA
jgi:hypothetical protein